MSAAVEARMAKLADLDGPALRDLSRQTRQTLSQLAAGKTRTASASPGTRLVREWNGVVQVVTIGEGGAIQWNDQTWNSLSEVARAITGTRWSGPAFFGLKKRVAA